MTGGSTKARPGMYSVAVPPVISATPAPEAIPLRGYEVDMVPYLYRLPGRFGPQGEPAARARTVELAQSLV